MNNDSRRHWSRQVMFEAGVKYITSLGKDLDVTEVSGDLWCYLLKNWKTFRSVAFEKHDICSGPIPGDKSDVIIMDQVLEHVWHPDRAVQNARASLKEGGAMFVSTPFLIKVHSAPVDLWRWTEWGLRKMISENGFDYNKISTGAWGNRQCVISNFDEWTYFDPEKHSLENQNEFPVTVWAFCQT